jgi:hypothetical protein
MPTIFDVLYREFCRARLVEMRKQLLLWPGASQGRELTGDDSRNSAADREISLEAAQDCNSHAGSNS